ncbi:S-adenosyl-L-methionine-dependent methyltransferase [Pilaira anomala]|nr:S-adenosyl-L-methionine-dependent methyltransferase [Pilaira anomala]
MDSSTIPSSQHLHEVEKQQHHDSEQISNVSSITDSMITSGRTFHHVPNSAYWLPNDDQEMDRLIGQHFALKTLFNGNITPTILSRLNMESGGTSVIDIGCGPGTWLMDVATEYPSCEFIGVDMCDIFPTNIRPPNVSFQVGNVLEKLPFADNSFDLVNLRLFIIALKREEWPILIKEAYRILKPGGYVQMVECGMLVKGNDFIRRAGRIFKETIESIGQEPYIAYKMGDLMKEHELEVIHYENKDVYLGKNDPLSKEFLWDVFNIFKAAQAVIQEPLGFNTETFPHFLDRLYKELQRQPDAIWSFSICVGTK